jgi:arsenite transporter
LNRLTLERRQVWIYLAAIIGGLWVGNTWSSVNHSFETLLWPMLMLLLYAAFAQVPLCTYAKPSATIGSSRGY